MARAFGVGVLASGEGTTVDGLAERLPQVVPPASIVLVAVDRPGAPVIARARARGIPTVVVPSKGTPTERWASELTRALEAGSVQLVVLAGFRTILPSSWVARWRGRAINVHPSLLPRHGGPGMYGDNVHRAVLAAREPETGATVHLVTDAVDGGPAIAQRRIAVASTDTPESLRARLRPVEIDLVTETIQRFASGALPLPYERPGGAVAGGDRTRAAPG